MKISSRYSAALVLCLALLSAGAFWATSAAAIDSTPGTGMLPDENLTFECNDLKAAQTKEFAPVDGGSYYTEPIGDPQPVKVRTGKTFFVKGLKTVELTFLSNGGHGFADGIGATHFWLDSSRPQPSAIWEKEPGTEFPATQEMRFHFFYTVEAFPGKILRSVNPAIMRSNHVAAFPPPPGTVYDLVEPVALEDANKPGKVIAYIKSNRVSVPEIR